VTLAEPRIDPWLARHPAVWMFRLATRHPNGELVAELIDARSRRLHFDLLAPCTFDFTIDGRSHQCAELLELTQDVVAYRWAAWAGSDLRQGRPDVLFRGALGRSEDVLSETTHAVNVSCSDYRAMLDRRNLTKLTTFAQQDQSYIVRVLLADAQSVPPDFAGQVNPANFDLALQPAVRAPDGTPVGNTWRLRDRTYTEGAAIGQLITDLSQVIDGFDWSVEPADPTRRMNELGYTGQATVWYPQRGVEKAWIADYGTTVASLTRSVVTTDFANVLVGIGGQDPADPSGNTNLTSWEADDSMAGPAAERAWVGSQSFSTTVVQASLDESTKGALQTSALLVPSYTFVVAPNAWKGPADCWLGDSVRLRIQSGRLDVDTMQRILSIDIALDDEGNEQVSMTLGRPAPRLAAMLRNTDQRIKRLEKR
jgi:hypothetical protein